MASGDEEPLDEFADEGEEPGAPPVPPVAAAVTSERTVTAARESLEPTIIASEIVALTVWQAGVSSARAASASVSTPTAGVAAPPAVAALVIGVSSAVRRGAVFAHARMSRLFRQPAWCDALSPAEIRALRGLVAFVAVLCYAGVVIGIWDRAVASDRRRALASVEVARAHPSTPPAVPVTICSEADSLCVDRGAIGDAAQTRAGSPAPGPRPDAAHDSGHSRARAAGRASGARAGAEACPASHAGGPECTPSPGGDGVAEPHAVTGRWRQPF